MPGFERLDAFQAATELALAVHRAVKSPAAPEGDAVLGDLEYVAFRVPALIARGWGCRERRLYTRCLDQAAAYLCELSYSLGLAREIGALPAEAWAALDGQAGRTRFYVLKLLLDVAGGPRDEKGQP